jgi:hypothetical protein
VVLTTAQNHDIWRCWALYYKSVDDAVQQVVKLVCVVEFGTVVLNVRDVRVDVKIPTEIAKLPVLM